MADRVHLPVVDGAAPPRRRHPEWIRATLPTKPAYFELRALVRELGLHTVCESASCPNIGECWTRSALTIMILGDICTPVVQVLRRHDRPARCRRIPTSRAASPSCSASCRSSTP